MKSRHDFKKMKDEQNPIVMVTAYDFPSAKSAEKAGVDMILVGDSLGMVVLGYDSTVPVTLEDMIHHTKAVRRGAPETYTVADMPFMTYHYSEDETLRNAARLFQESGAHALKIEGAGPVADKIAALTGAGIPVVAHLGLTPQSVGVLGGYKVQGKDAESAKRLLEDALSCESAGAIALVLECVPAEVGKYISSSLAIPVIGIGAGSETDGQVLVYHDLTGYGVDRVPKFAEMYGSIGASAEAAIASYAHDVRKREFPSAKHSFRMKDEELTGLYGGKA